MWFCSFGPFLHRFFRVLDFEARFCSFLQHHGLRLLVLIIGGLQLADVVHSFSVAFITHTLRAALQRNTDIAISIFNDFGHGFAFFVAFCCGFCYPLMSPSIIVKICLRNNKLLNIQYARTLNYNKLFILFKKNNLSQY